MSRPPNGPGPWPCHRGVHRGPEVSGETLAGTQPGAIADRICRHFGFRGGGQAVNTAHSSSLLAVASAAALLTSGELDFVLAGGVDVSLDPFELGALAQAGVLASETMRIYDASPTGFLPGEGCGMLALMRSADARAADMPVYAEIVGWGVSSPGQRDMASADPDSQLLALERAYDRAGVDPADVQLIEGDGRGTADDDLAELTALTVIRAGAAAPAVLGSVKANIGHTKAAAGAAGLIKAALAVNAGSCRRSPGAPGRTRYSRTRTRCCACPGRLKHGRPARGWPQSARWTRRVATCMWCCGASRIRLRSRSTPAPAPRPASPSRRLGTRPSARGRCPARRARRSSRSAARTGRRWPRSWPGWPGSPPRCPTANSGTSPASWAARLPAGRSGSRW